MRYLWSLGLQMLLPAARFILSSLRTCTETQAYLRVLCLPPLRVGLPDLPLMLSLRCSELK